jgi:hypothetical protein
MFFRVQIEGKVRCWRWSGYFFGVIHITILLQGRFVMQMGWIELRANCQSGVSSVCVSPKRKALSLGPCSAISIVHITLCLYIPILFRDAFRDIDGRAIIEYLK